MNGEPTDAAASASELEALRARVKALEAQLPSLHEESRIQETLLRVATAFANELDQQKLLQLVTDEATALTSAQFGAFFFNSTRENGEVLLLYTLSGAPPEAFSKFPLPRATPIFGPTFRGDGVMRLDDVRKDPRYGKWGPQPKGHLPVVSYLAVPVISGSGEVLGGLFFGHGEPARFTSAHERIALGLAAQAAAALEKARLYKQLQQSEARAREADRRKDEFLAMLGHELRNPLAPIMTALQLMEMRGQLGQVKELTVIDRQVKHVARLVDDLLDIARVTRGKIEVERKRIDLKQVVQRAVEMASPLIERRAHRLEVTLPNEPLYVDGDTDRLAQVISNLLTNAAKFTPMHGHLRLAGHEHEGKIVLTVNDDGDGIAPELLPRVFELFVQGERTSERAQGGLGIGLALVKSLIELHGGRVSAHSAGIGRGTEMRIELPRSAAEPEEAEPLQPVVTPAVPRAKVLLVDDNTDAAEVLAEALTAYGYEVSLASDGAQALELAKTLRPRVVLLDLGLPVMDGIEVAKHLKALWGDHPVSFIALTGYGQPSDKAKTKAAGFHAHLVKPVSVKNLIALLALAT